MAATDTIMGSIEGSSTGNNSDTRKWTVHVEVRLKPRAAARFDSIRSLVQSFINSYDRIGVPSVLEGWQDTPELATSVEQIAVSEAACPTHTLTIQEISLQIHVYQPSDTDSFEEFSTGTGSRGEDDETMAATVCELPNRSWEGLWDSLIYADDIKLKLLDYIHATLVLSDANVDFNLVSWNRVVLLHGPPGTGKTSLCRALAQKLSIRLSQRYAQARLLEINSHSLFSKWFSESGKLVQRLFTSIQELADDEDGFLVVLIDEVESLTAARAGAMAGTEPSDGLRVVNALLTQLDKLKHRKNVLIMSTSNLVKAIDSAFVDRADIVQYVDLPSREAIYNILRTCLIEMTTKGIVAPVTVPTLAQAQMFESTSKGSATSTGSDSSGDPHTKTRSTALKLFSLAALCRGQALSGRSLRRLPVLALARYLGVGYVLSTEGGAQVESWLDAMERVIKEQTVELKRVN